MISHTLCSHARVRVVIWAKLFSVNEVTSPLLCLGWRYRVSLTLSGRTVTGQVRVALFGSEGNTQQYDIFR